MAEQTDKIENTEDLSEILPTDWRYKICQKHYRGRDSQKLEVTLKVALFSPEDIKLWVKALEEKTSTSYSIRSTGKCTGQKVKFKQILLCHHKTRHRDTYKSTVKNRTKNTNCPSSLNITLMAVKKNYRGRNPIAPDPEMPCMITFVATHNHEIGSADFLKFRRVSHDTRKKLLDLFHSRHSPTSALECLRMEIILTHDNFETLLADRSICPDYNYCHYLFKTEYEKTFGPVDFQDENKNFLIKKLEEYNAEIGEECVMFHFEDSDYVIALCPPLFKRIHQHIDSASEIVFMDTTLANVDRDGSKLFIILTHSECGDLPLGIFITSSTNAQNISVGFQMLQRMLGDTIFHGNPEGPQVFMTDDCRAERIAVQSVWKKTECLLDIFHVLQAVYRWLLTAKNGIPKDYASQFFQEFRSVLYAPTVEECEEKYEIAIESASSCSNYVQYLQTYWRKKELWALSHRPFVLDGQTHISGAAMRLLKEKLLSRVKSFNLAQLVDFFMSKFVDYYKIRLLDAAHNGTVKDKLLQMMRLPPSDVVEKIQKLNENMYIVPSEKEDHLQYIVYTDVLVCTCFSGKSGTVCKHLDWVHMLYHSEAYQRNIDDMETRSTFLKIATGQVPPAEVPPSSSDTLQIKSEAQDTGHDTDDDADHSEHGSSSPLRCGSESDPLLIPNGEDTEKDALEDGQKLIRELSDCFTDFLKHSPTQAVPALKGMLDRAKKMKTLDGAASSCPTFTSDNLEDVLPICPIPTVSHSKISRKCVVPNCKNPTNTGIRFPLEENLRKKWLESLRIPNFQPIETSFVCLDHFDKSNDDNNLEDVLQTCPIPTVSQDEAEDNDQNSATAASSAQENGVCRLCMKSQNVVADIFDSWEQEKITWSLAIIRCLPMIKISKRDRLPKGLCRSCMEIIKLFHTFRKSCIRMDLRQRYKPRIVKAEKRKSKNLDESGIAQKVLIVSDNSEQQIILPDNLMVGTLHCEKTVNEKTQITHEDDDKQNIVKKKFNEVKSHLRKALEGKLTEEMEDAENIILEVHNEDSPPQVQNLSAESLTLVNTVCGTVGQPSNIVKVRDEQMIKVPKTNPVVGVQVKVESRTGTFPVECLEQRYGLRFCVVDSFLMEYRLTRKGCRQLKCITPKCSARAEQKLVNNVFNETVRLKTAHNHPHLSETERKKQIYLEMMRRKIQIEESVNFKDIYEELSKKDPEIEELLPVQDVMNQICSQPIKPSWPPVESFDEFFDGIETDEFRDLHFTHSNKQFYQEKLTSSDGQSKAVIFANADTIEKLSNSEIMYVDSSFRIGGNKLETNYHLLTVLVWREDSYFPIMFALVNQKSQAIYKEIFIHLRDILAPHLRPKEIVTDYEANLYHALAEIYPEARVGGSVFYYIQNIFKKISSMNLSHEITKNKCFRKIYQMISMLPLLPLNMIHDCLAYIESRACQFELEELMQPIFEYVRTEWMEKVTPDLFCVHHLENRISENVMAPFKKLRDFLLLTKIKRGRQQSLNIGTVVDKIIDLEDFLQRIYAAPSKKTFARDLSSAEKENVIRAWQYIESHSNINLEQFFQRIVDYVKCMEDQLWIWGFYGYTGSADDELINVANISVVSAPGLSEDSSGEDQRAVIEEQSEPHIMFEVVNAESSEKGNHVETLPIDDEVVRSNFLVNAVNDEGQHVVVNMIINEEDWVSSEEDE